MAYLAKPPGDCCLQGTLHKGDPRGRREPIAEVDSYIATPAQDRANGHILLYFPDVWGFFNNGLLVMDAFADSGYLTIGMDYFRGDPVWRHRKSRNDTSNPNFDFEAWKTKHMDFALQAVPGWVAAVKEKYGQPGTKFACVGYCFGAPFVCNELASGVCAAGAFAHPAFLEERHFANLEKPLFLSCAETDHTFDAPSRNAAVDLLKDQNKKYQLQLFSGVEHGFALRGNPDDAYERWVKEQSLKGMVEWFDFWLSQ